MTDKRSHVRLASKAAGDDVSFSRYVRVTGVSKPGKPHSPRIPGLELPAIREGRSFFQKSVKRTTEMKNLLVSGQSNMKIGRDARIGKLNGYWIYTLSLEERKTCPSSCFHWQTCYGNGMPYAKRIDHTDPEFLPRLETEIAGLLKQAERRAGAPGIIIRLHALGDFYSPEYVVFWDRMLREHPKLVIFGYTAWLSGTAIGWAINELINAWPGRAMIRFSNGGYETRSTVPIVSADQCPPGAFVCPEQTGQFEACGKCGACWTTLKNVAFVGH
jgi:hypothetical protein